MADGSILLTSQNIQAISFFLALYVSLFCFIGSILGRLVLTLIKRYTVTPRQSCAVDGD